MWPTEQNREAWERRFHLEPPAARLPDGVRERLPDVIGKHVLDLGCGTGETTAQLIALGALVTGIDPSEEALTAARERVPDAAFFQAELHDIPLQLRRRRFSLVYAGEGTLARVPDLAALLSTAAAALRKGGHFVLCERHPVAECVEPVGLRWRESYFDEGRARVGDIITTVLRSELTLEEVDELPAEKESGARLDQRLPALLLVQARKISAQ